MNRKDSLDEWYGLIEGYNRCTGVDRYNGVKYPGGVPRYTAPGDHDRGYNGFGTHGYGGIHGHGGLYGNFNAYPHVKPVVDTTGIMFDCDTHDWPALIIHASEPYEIDHADDEPVIKAIEPSPKTQVANTCVPKDACTHSYLQSRFDTVSEDLKATLEDLLKSAKATVPATELAAIAAVKVRIEAAKDIIETAARALCPGPLVVEPLEPIMAQPA